MVPQKVDLMVHPKVLSTGLRTAAQLGRSMAAQSVATKADPKASLKVLQKARQWVDRKEQT